MKELNLIQTKLKAPKGKEAKGRDGKVIYTYRSCEDILDAVKDLLIETKCTLTVTDDVLVVGNRIYVKATATITNEKGESVSTSAFAREPDALAAMNPSQVTGAASSYARKYALNGLLAIDDTKDVDNHPAEQAPSDQKTESDGRSNELSQKEVFEGYAKPAIAQANTREELAAIYNGYPILQTMREFTEALTARRKALGIKNSNEQ